MILLRKLIYRPRASTLKAKWLKKFKQEEDFRAPTQFTKRNIGIYHETAAGRFYIKNNPISIT